MPTIPPKTITDLPRPVREQFKKLAFERSVLGYAFSFERLLHFFTKVAGMTPEDARSHIEACVIAWKDDECKKIKDDLGARITNLYTENGIDKTLRDYDPFGRAKDYIMAEGTAVSFSQNRALELGVAGIVRWKCPECEKVVFTASGKPGTQCPTVIKDLKGNDVQCPGVIGTKTVVKEFAFNGQALKALFDLATNKTKYVSLQARDVKEGNGQ